MSRLTIYPDTNPKKSELDTADVAEITKALSGIGVRFERWEASKKFPRDADDATIEEAYEADIERIKKEGGYQTVDILRCNAAMPR